MILHHWWINFRSLQGGDHLAVKGRIPIVRYYHHGIFLGPDKEVADFGSDYVPCKEINVRVVPLSEFTGRRQLFRFVYPTGCCLSPRATVNMAKEVAQTPEIWGQYHFVRNNCEHFATKCKTGRPYSIQVEIVRRHPMRLFSACFGARS